MDNHPGHLDQIDQPIDRFIDYLRTLGSDPFQNGLEPIFQKYGITSIEIDEELQEDTSIDLHMKIEWVPSLPSAKTIEKIKLPKLAKNQETQSPPKPAQEIEDYHKLIQTMEKDHQDNLMWCESECEGEGEGEGEENPEYCTHHLYYPLPTEYRKIPIYAVITYPIKNKGIFKITFDDHIPYTYASLWYAHAAAYRMMYRLEEMYVSREIKTVNPSMMNRETTAGPFGIWGHALGDLVYNGQYEIDGLPNQFIVCDLDCDS